jgi:hypothetical protein
MELETRCMSLINYVYNFLPLYLPGCDEFVFCIAPRGINLISIETDLYVVLSFYTFSSQLNYITTDKENLSEKAMLIFK